MRITLNYGPGRGRALSCVVALLISTASLHGQVALEPGAAAGEVGALLDIAVGEYALAVDEGGIVNELEYEETRLLLEGARSIATASLSTGESGRRLLAALDSAEVRMSRVAPAAELRDALADARAALFDGWGAVALPTPAEPLSLERGEALYAINCADCHGDAGRGDGPEASNDPAPADFTDLALLLESSPARFFQVISYGIPNTGMEGWRTQLSEQDRWHVIAYLNRLGHSEERLAKGERLYGERLAGAGDLDDFTTLASLTGEDLRELLNADVDDVVVPGAEPLSNAGLAALAGYLRTRLEAGDGDELDPEVLVADVRAQLLLAIELKDDGDVAGAAHASLMAYMAFEGFERELGARAPGLSRAIEADFFAFRETLSDPDGDTRAAYARVDSGLSSALVRVAQQPSIWSDFFVSLIIIVREGVEAILIIGALLTFLTRSGHAEQRSAVYTGVLAAIIASLLTALVAEMVFEIAPAQQEVLEGITMLIAVVVLFSVSYWLVSKIEVRRWQNYIREKMSQALSTGSQLALASVAFFAVFREGVETVLFYSALLGSAGSGAMVALGFLIGVALLAVIYTGIYQFGMRIPLRPFFGITSGVLYFMAFVFAGKGIRELQEAGVIGITRVSGIPQIDLLGIYPTLESLIVQGILLGALVAALAWTFLLAPARRRALALD